MPARARSFLFALCLALAACALPARAAGFAVAGDALLRQAAVMLGLGALLLFYRRKQRAPALRLALEASLWTIALSSLFNFPMFLCLRHGSGFSDASLSRVDGALGISVPALVHWVNARPALAAASSYVYDSLRAVSVVSILLPALRGRSRQTAEMLLALGLGVLVSLVCLASGHAVGPWVNGEFSPSAAQQGCEAMLRAIAGGEPLTIDVTRSAPLIAFPSWHAALAVLSATSLGRFAGLRWVASTWALFVVLSTLTSGWHYAIDALAGVLVAFSSLAGARLVLDGPRPAFTRPNRRPYFTEE